MLTYDMKLTPTESALITAIKWLQFGTLQDLELPESGDQAVPVQLTRPQMEMIKAIREGSTNIALIQVHQCDPTYMEVNTFSQPGGWKCKKRHKFQ